MMIIFKLGKVFLHIHVKKKKRIQNKKYFLVKYTTFEHFKYSLS